MQSADIGDRTMLIKTSYSKSGMLTAFVVAAAVSITFLRFVSLNENVSFDHRAYVSFFQVVQAQPLLEIIEYGFVFPYVYIYGVAPFEIGFVIISKMWTSVFTSPEIAYASLAATSLGLRVYIMRKLRAPIVWILLLNIYALTLFEANALRLGIAATIILCGLYNLVEGRNRRLGFALLAVSTLFHLQAALFVGPFVVSWLMRDLLSNSKAWLFMSILGMSAAAVVFTQLLPNVGNEKIAEYVLRGTSGSAGLTVTSLLALCFLISTFVARGRGRPQNRSGQIWAAITTASVPSFILFTTLTTVAVVGDRAWQLAFLICATFFITDWVPNQQKRISFVFLIALSLVSTVNITIRYPLSNFFSPMLPGISSR